MAQSSNGFQTGLAVIPSAPSINNSNGRTVQFYAQGGLAGNVGITWSMGSPANGSINAAGLYTAPNSVSSATHDQVLATAVDGSQAQAFVNLIP